MDEIIFSRGYSDVLVVFIVVVLACSVLGIVIYLGLRNSKYRRRECRELWDQPVSRSCSLFVSSVIALPLLVYMYFDCWTHFYRISQRNGSLYVHYLFPNRTNEILDVRDLRVSTEVEFRKGPMYKIKLTVNGDRVFTSQVLMRNELDEALAKLNNVLKKMREHRS